MATPDYSDKPPAYSETQQGTTVILNLKEQEAGGTRIPADVGCSRNPAGEHGVIIITGDSNPMQVFDTVQVESGEIDATFVFSDRRIRQAFVRKVFMILTAQLLVTTGICAPFYFVNDMKLFLQRNEWLCWISYAVFIVTYVILASCRSCARRTPMNYCALGILTFAMSYMVATITSFYDVESVMIAFGITFGICLGLTLFTWQTRIDFSFCSGLLVCLLMVLFLTGNACWIWGLVVGWNRVMMVVYGGVGALVFSVFLICDVGLVIGDSSYRLSPEEYIYGAIQIYTDVVYIFLYILMAIGGLRK